jgi:hypothetical protein
MSKKKKTTKSTMTTAPSAFAQPFVSDAAQTFRPAYDKGMAIADSYTPQFDQARGLISDTLSGRYLDQGNPYLQNVIDSSNRDITDQVNGQFNSRFGSGYHTGALARALAENEGRLRYGNYATERGYQNNAIGQLGSLAGQQTLLPSIPASTYADNVSGLLGRYATQDGKEVSKSSGGLLGSLAKAAQIAALVAAPSDRRLKTDIEKIGEQPDGLGVYRYRYVTDAPDSPLRTGVMADEVERLRPWALGPKRGEFATVVYGKL